MLKCLKCGAVMESEAVFCGRCGARLKADTTVFDGKKRKLSRRFVFQSGSSKKQAILFLASFLLLLFLGVWLLSESLSLFGEAAAKVPNAFSQIALKGKYLAEGVPMRYIQKELSLLHTALFLLVSIVFACYLILYSGYFSYFFGHHLCLHIKYKEYYPYHKPISMEKFSHLLLTISITVFFVFLIVYLLLGLAGILI